MEDRLQEILMIALENDVTDIHFSIMDGSGEAAVEMRVHDRMRRLKRNPADLKLFHYLMYRANLDISNALQPQTGSFEETVGKERLSLRFAIVSGYRRCSGVLRILNNHSALAVEDLCADRETVEWMKQIPDHRWGFYVFSGPTGSGKTTSLYTILNSVKGKKIYTLEDPIEVVNESYVQLQINEKASFSYAEGIRQLMRQDPDLVMIGEIRDSTAAKMAVRCALTGHLVVTTLHSSSCTAAVSRLIELGVDEYQLRDVLKGISCQRLYDTPFGRKTGIYEFMDEKEVAYYFENRRNSGSFKPLKERIREAAEEGRIEEEEAKKDLA